MDSVEEPCSTRGGYAISVVTSPADICLTEFDCMTDAAWDDHWNETIVVAAPQVVSFVAPLNFVGPWVPRELEYTDSPYVTLSFAESVGVTTTYTATAAGTGTVTSSSFSSSESDLLRL